MDAEAIVEFRELEAIAPDSAMCHECLGTALFRTWDFEGARKEYRKSIELDPSEPGPHIGLGGILEEEKSYDAALAGISKGGKSGRHFGRRASASR